MLNALLNRWNRKRPELATGPVASTRLATRSDAARPAGDSLWQSLLRLMPGDSDPWSSGAAAALPAARRQFEQCLAGLDGDGVDELQRSIRRARSLGDLWHLRTGLYTEIARAHSQWEAEQRLAPLNAVFVGLAGAQARRH